VDGHLGAAPARQVASWPSQAISRVMRRSAVTSCGDTRPAARVLDSLPIAELRACICGLAYGAKRADGRRGARTGASERAAAAAWLLRCLNPLCAAPAFPALRMRSYDLIDAQPISKIHAKVGFGLHRRGGSPCRRLAPHPHTHSSHSSAARALSTARTSPRAPPCTREDHTVARMLACPRTSRASPLAGHRHPRPAHRGLLCARGH
jgi:hypothetical protein